MHKLYDDVIQCSPIKTELSKQTGHQNQKKDSSDGDNLMIVKPRWLAKQVMLRLFLIGGIRVSNCWTELSLTLLSWHSALEMLNFAPFVQMMGGDFSPIADDAGGDEPKKEPPK